MLQEVKICVIYMPLWTLKLIKIEFYELDGIVNIQLLIHFILDRYYNTIIRVIIIIRQTLISGFYIVLLHYSTVRYSSTIKYSTVPYSTVPYITGKTGKKPEKCGKTEGSIKGC